MHLAVGYLCRQRKTNLTVTVVPQTVTTLRYLREPSQLTVEGYLLVKTASGQYKEVEDLFNFFA